MKLLRTSTCTNDSEPRICGAAPVAVEEVPLENELVTKAWDTAREYFDKVVDAPLKELGGVLSDQVGYWRLKNQVRIMLKAKAYLEQHGIDPKRALPSTLVPLLESAGDTDDETLSDLFSGLLTTHLDPAAEDDVHPSYGKVLAQLAPVDAQVLAAYARGIVALSRDYRNTRLTLAAAASETEVSEPLLLLTFQNLWRLGICDRGATLDEMNKEKQVVFTDYGWSFVKACMPEISSKAQKCKPGGTPPTTER